MERIRRRACHGLSPGDLLTGPPPLSPDQARAYGVYFETSPLYHHLNEVVASDSELLEVLNSIENPPRQNMLFAGVQFLLLKDQNHDLAAFYENLGSDPLPVRESGGPFRDFVLSRRGEIAEIGRTKYTQTNEPRRCVALVPALWATGTQEFHLIDFGTSGGLNLGFDRYAYRWGETTWGPKDSRVRLTTEMRGEPVTPHELMVLSRVGLDLNPIDVHVEDDRLWLEALIWPEHHERRERLLAAIDITWSVPTELVAGDALQTLVEVFDALPEGESAVVINSFILNQFGREDRRRLSRIVDEERLRRPVARISMEWLDKEAAGADLCIDVGSGLERIGLAQPHGEWLELYARP